MYAERDHELLININEVCEGNRYMTLVQICMMYSTSACVIGVIASEHPDNYMHYCNRSYILFYCRR